MKRQTHGTLPAATPNLQGISQAFAACGGERAAPARCSISQNCAPLPLVDPDYMLGRHSCSSVRPGACFTHWAATLRSPYGAR